MWFLPTLEEITQMRHPHSWDWREDHISGGGPSSQRAKTARISDSADNVKTHGVEERENRSKSQIHHHKAHKSVDEKQVVAISGVEASGRLRA